MPRSITVVATGSPVPYERDPRRTIGSEPATLTTSTYYLRRLAAGELRLVDIASEVPRAAPMPSSPPTPSSATPVPAPGKVS